LSIRKGWSGRVFIEQLVNKETRLYQREALTASIYSFSRLFKGSDGF
jgi:hypothetical protein